MGQYYYPIVLDENGKKIIVWMCAHNYNNGLKLMEHSYLGNNFVSTFEFGLSPEGPYYKSRVVWAGDYADKEPDQEKNLYQMCDEYTMISPQVKETKMYRYIINHSKKQFVDKTKAPTKRVEYTNWALHPLPLLTCEGNGRGGGDYRGESPLIGSWARDIISVDEVAPEGFEELVFDLVE